MGDRAARAVRQTVARRVSAVFEPVTALESLLVFVSANSGPVVGDRDDRLAIDVFVSDHDLPSGAAMLDRIVDEIGDGIEDQVAIAGYERFAIADDGEAGAHPFGRGIVQLHNLAGDFRQIDGAE